MLQYVLLFGGLLIGFCGFSQTTILGYVFDDANNPIAGANVSIKNGFDGATSDAKGFFIFETTLVDNQSLVTSFIGYETSMQTVFLEGKKLQFSVILKQKIADIQTVTVTVGSFEASHEKKAVTLRPRDIVTVAGSVGDITGALGMLPGAQRSGLHGFLIVRGGDASETKTFIDGSCVEKPYTSAMPDLPSRGRFSPMLFKGTIFSTGGYSAQYGQALSSVIQLETMDFSEKNQVSISLMSVGVGASAAYKTDSLSVSSEVSYTNMKQYYLLTGSNIEWLEAPHSLSNITSARFKVGKTGIIKSMFQFSTSSSGMLYKNLDSYIHDSLHLRNGNMYLNNSYKSIIGNKITFSIHSGIMYDNDRLSFSIADTVLHTSIASGTIGFSLKRRFSKTMVKYGVDVVEKLYHQNFNDFEDSLDIHMKFSQPISATYLDFETSVSKKFLVKHGYRAEYSNQNNEFTFSPRISCAYKLRAFDHISFAWGIFRQLQGDNYVKFNNALPSAKAIQYIANYQYEKNDRLFRTEMYYKSYSNLIQYSYENNPNPNSYSTLGNGNALGADVFFRDTKTIKNGDFWISYSYIHTVRKYKNYIKSVTPEYVSPHSMSVVYKQYISVLHTQFGMSYLLASPKLYNDLNSDLFMAAKLQATNDVSLSFSYVTRICNKPTIIHGSVSNVLGINNVYGYRYSSFANDMGKFDSMALRSVAKRMYFIGMFITM